MARTGLALAMLAVTVASSAGQTPATDRKAPDGKATDSAPKIDWAGFRTLLEAGEYAKAIPAADAILEAVKPNRKEPDFLARSVDTIDVLMRRGFAELQLGKLDAAEATLVATEETFKDREFLKQLSTLEKKGGESAATPLVDLDLRRIELQNLRAAVHLERLRKMHEGPAALPGVAAQADPSAIEAIRGQVEAIESLINASEDVRKKLADRFELGGLTVVGSPHKKALMSGFHPELLAGITAFELSRLPFDMPPPAQAETPPKAGGASGVINVDGLNRKELLARALVHFEAAAKALDEAFEATIPKGVATAPAEKRLEAEVLLLRLSLARCFARFHNGQLAEAQKDVDESLRLHHEMTSVRKLANAESHPELLVPLIYATELALAESDAQAKAGMGDEARSLLSKASEFLTKAAAIPLDDEHPRRQALGRLAAAIENRQAKFAASVVNTDAADVAAQRIRRAVEGTKPGS